MKLRDSKKKYFETKKDYEEVQKKLVQISDRVLDLIKKISNLSGKERGIDGDLKGILNFSTIKYETSMDKPLDSGNHLSVYMAAFADNDRLWQQMVNFVVETRKTMMSWLDGKIFVLKIRVININNWRKSRKYV